MNIKKKILYISILLFTIGCGGTTPPIVKPEPIAIIIPEVIPVVEVIPEQPNPISIRSIDYNLDAMKITWEKSNEGDFKSYTLYRSLDSSESNEMIKVFTSILDTTFSLQSFDPTLKNLFRIDIENGSNLVSEGIQKSNTLETLAPSTSKLFEVTYQNDLEMRWTMNNDIDFNYYEILKSRDSEMISITSVKKLKKQKDTLYILPMDSIFFYKIRVKDKWGLESFSNIIKGDITVNALNTEFSLIETKVLDLSNQKVFGPFPEEISQLLNLSVLRLNNNFLNGSIPESIYKLKKLKVLNLSHNSLTGELSSKISSLVALEELWIGDNNLAGKIPFQIGELENLAYFNFSKNKFEGQIPESIGHLKNLKYLNGWKNRLNGLLPSTLGDLDRLEFFSLGDNQLTGEIPPELGDAKSLKSIGLFENQLIGKIPKEISELPKLEYLGLFSNNLDGIIPDSLFRKGTLVYLNLNNNNLTDLNQDLICKSGYNWENTIFYDISKNNLPEVENKCSHGVLFHQIYNSYK